MNKTGHSKESHERQAKSLSDYWKRSLDKRQKEVASGLIDFESLGKHAQKKQLLFERGHRCEGCSLTEWRGLAIPIQIHHKDGNNKNRTRENSELLCANCHSQTDSWTAKNRGKLASSLMVKRDALNVDSGGSIPPSPS